jgi:AraC-like DNA-binding protein
VFSNRALIEFSGTSDASLITGKYNLINDPVCNDQLGMREGIQKAFRGEYCIAQNYPVPIQDLVDRGIIKEKPFEKATMDYLLYPVWKDDKLHVVVCVFVVRSMYFGRPDLARAKEYIDNHWQDEYDPKALAKAVNMSVTQLYRIFKQHTGMTPGDYYNKAKIERISKKLNDKNLSIKEAFAACGADSRGKMARVFKQITGFSPTEYRKSLL